MIEWAHACLARHMQLGWPLMRGARSTSAANLLAKARWYGSACEIRSVGAHQSSVQTDPPIVTVYLKGVAGILLATSSLKLLSVASGAGVLSATDPLIGLPLGWLTAFEAALEVVACIVLVSRIGSALRLLVVFWLGALFCTYHALLAVLDPGAHCPCLGTLYGRLGIKPATADAVAKLLAAWFFLGPLLIWVRQWLYARRRVAVDKCAKERACARHG